MSKDKGPKIECRARTGGMYSRAGHLWTPEFQPIPKEILRDDDLVELLRADPHLEVRVDGKFVSGPRAGAAATSHSEDQATLDAANKRIAELEGELESVDERLDEARSEVGSLTKQLEAANKSNAELTAQLKAASKPAQAVTPVSGAKGDDTAPPKG